MNKKSSEELQKYQGNDWFQLLLEEIGALIVETRFSIEEQIIRAKHEVGKLITNIAKQEDVSVAELVMLTAEQLNVSTRTIQQAVQFYNYDTELTVLKEGKNISWRKCLLRMQTPKEIKPCEHTKTKTLIVCCDCGDKVTHVD